MRSRSESRFSTREAGRTGTGADHARLGGLARRRADARQLVTADPDKALHAGLDDTQEAHGYNVIHRALTARFILCVASLGDGPRDDSKRGSLPGIMALLNEEEARRWPLIEPPGWT